MMQAVPISKAMIMQPLLVQSMYGLGDNLFIRPLVAATAAFRPVYLNTTWPELFDDIPNVQFVQANTTLRTQRKNVERQPASRWVSPPPGIPSVRMRYGDAEIKRWGSIPRVLEAVLPIGQRPYEMTMPRLFEVPPVLSPKPIALVRPVTTRKEWLNTARNPLPEYVANIAQHLMATHHVVVVADLAPGEEQMEPPGPPSHQAFLRGELSVRQLLRLVAMSDIIVGGVGWIVPASIAAKRPAFIIQGGQGAHNSPSVITDPRMDLTRIGFARPNNFCNCSNMRHPCNKIITDLPAQWNNFVSRSAIASSGTLLPI